MRLHGSTLHVNDDDVLACYYVGRLPPVHDLREISYLTEERVSLFWVSMLNFSFLRSAVAVMGVPHVLA